jgi:septal ring factor EnvC (AmiA/AmiB activator)
MKESDRFEILLEHIAKDVRTVAEGHINLNQKIDRNHEEARRERESIKQQMGIHVKTLSGKIDINREKIEEVDNKLSTNLEKHEDRIKTLEVIS